MLSIKSSEIKSSPVRELLKYSKDPEIISLAGGIPATDLIDVDGIDGVIAALLSKEHRNLYQYSVTEGEYHLREQLTFWHQKQGISFSADQLLITNGSQQGIDLLSRIFLERGDRVLVERPTYLAALQVFRYTDASVDEIPYAGEQIDLTSLETGLAKGDVKALYLMPNFGNPSGRTLSYAQRVALIDLSVKYQVLIIEDDPYGHLRFSGEALPSLFTLASRLPEGNQTVCYLSTFSKIFSPGLRLGWLVMPKRFYQAATVAKQAFDLHTSTLTQSIAAHYLETGRLDDCIGNLKRVYRARRNALTEAIENKLQGKLSWNTPDGGMFLWCRLSGNIDAGELLRECVKEKVVFVPGEVFFAKDPERNSLRLSYSMVTENTADEAVNRIARALEKFI